MIGNHPPPEGAEWKTYPESLEEAGVSWEIYFTERRKKTLRRGRWTR